MNTYKNLIASFVSACCVFTYAFATTTVVSVVAGSTAIVVSTTTATSSLASTTKPTLTHQQEIWISALAWCESHGNPQAINKVDRDGTPSYGEFQFKPQTFESLKKKYSLTGDIMDGSVQRKIVEQMVLDKDISDRELKYTQFPDCIQRHIGLPKRNLTK